MKSITFHAQERLSERGISPNKVFETIETGKMFYRQGMLFYVHKDNRLIVVTSNDLKEGESSTVITAYCRNNAMKYVKLKDKRLYKNNHVN